MLTFDDGLADFYTNAFPALETAEIKATNYMITSGIDDELGYYLSTAQAGEIYAAGHDLGNHSNSHPDFSTLTQAQIETELSTAKNTLDAAGWTRASDHVAYPFGISDADTLAAMTATGMKTGRRTIVGYISLDDVHDTYSLYGLPIYYVKNTTKLMDVENKIINSALYNEKVCLLFHSIKDVAEDTYDWPTADFVALLAYINSIGMTTLTISEWYALYQAAYP